MKLFYFRPLTVLVGSLVFLFAISSQSLAGTFSGRVVDEWGNPIAEELSHTSGLGNEN